MAGLLIRRILEWADENDYNCTFIGSKESVVDGFSSLEKYRKNTITWVKKQKNVDAINGLDITCAVVQKGIISDIPNQLIVDNAKEFFFVMLDHFFCDSPDGLMHQAGTFIGKDVDMHETVRVGCNCTLDGMIRIGKGTIIEHGVTIINTVEIGEDCIIHSGAVIGKDGFGYSFDKSLKPVKARHFGGVTIGNRVEIGANSVIDRGTIDNTTIGDDAKIDSLVIVAHNTEIGTGSLIVGGVTVGGSCRIGDQSYLAPQAIIMNQISVGNNSFVGMGERVNHAVPDNTVFVNGKQLPNKDYRRFL